MRATSWHPMVALRGAILLGCAALVAHSTAGAQRPQPLDATMMRARAAATQVLVDVRIDENVHDEMLAQVSVTGEILLPLEALMTFAGIRVVSHRGTVSVRGQDQRPSFTLDRRHRSLSIGRHSRTLLPGDYADDHSTLFVSTQVAAKLLGVAIDADVMAATVLLRDAARLPIARRQFALTQARERALSAEAEAKAVAPLAIDRYRTSIQGDYDLFLSRSWQASGGTGASALAEGQSEWSAYLQTRLAGRVAGGNLAGRIALTPASARASDVQWTKYRPTSTRLTRVVVGALSAGGLTGARVHGISLDNQPVDFSERRMVRVRGRAQDGWQYALRQGGVWATDESRNEGEYDFRLPMIGDVARVDITGWGPDGQERRYVRSIHAVPLRVRAGRWQYATAAGRCATSPNGSPLRGGAVADCRWFAGGDVRVGLRDWLVARSGVDAVPGVIAPYVGGAAVFRDRLTLQASHTVGTRAVHHGAFSAQFEPSPALSASIAQSTSLTGVTTQFTSLHLSPTRWDGRFGIDGWLSKTRGDRIPTEIGRLGVLGMLGNVRVELFGSRTFTGAPTGGDGASAFRGNALGTEVTAAPAWLRLPRVERAWVGAGAERASNGVLRSNVRLDASLSRAFIEISRTFANARDAGRWSVTFTPRSTAARQSTTYAHSGSGNGFTGSSALIHTISGNATWEAGTRSISLSSAQATNRGTIAGRAFLDLNDNRHRDEAEPYVGDVPVIVGNRALRTDSLGRFRSEHMSVTELIAVAVDSLALPSPCWRAGAARWQVRAVEGGVIDVSLPIRRGGILEGQIVRMRSDGTAEPSSSTPWSEQPALQVSSVGTGEVFAADVFGAGTFYLLGVPFGDYDISLPVADQRRLKVTARPARVSVTASQLDDSSDENTRACPVTTAIVRAYADHIEPASGPIVSLNGVSIPENSTALRVLTDSVFAARTLHPRRGMPAASDDMRDPRADARVRMPAREYLRRSRHVRAVRTRARVAGAAPSTMGRPPARCELAINITSASWALLECHTDEWRRDERGGARMLRKPW